MSKVSEICNWLDGLAELIKRREDIEWEKRKLDKPISEEKLIKEMRSTVAGYTDEQLGINVSIPPKPEEPKKTEFEAPIGRPVERSVSARNMINYVWIARSILLAVVIMIAIIGKETGGLIASWYIIGVIVVAGLSFILRKSKVGENFKFKGLFLGFPQIFKISKYKEEKLAVDTYNRDVYPKELIEYEKKYKEAQAEYAKVEQKYEKDLAEYNAAYQERERAIKAAEEARKATREKLVAEFIPEAKKIVSELKKEYDAKVAGFDGQLKKIDEEIEAYPEPDDEIIYQKDKYDSGTIRTFIEILEAGRASSLKEAINVCLEDRRKQEEEWNRQQEAEERQRALEEQNDLMRERNRQAEIHEREMARQAQIQSEIAEKESERRARAEEEQTRAAQNQANAAARLLCSKCRRKENCYSRFNPPANCSRYSPQ